MINRSFIISDVRLGIIGAGQIAREHLKVIKDMDGVIAVGITSRTTSKAEDLTQSYGIEQVFEKIDDLIKKCVPDDLMVLAQTFARA